MLVYLCISSSFKIATGVANRIKKIMGEFLWSGAGESIRDHLVNWEVCRKSKEDRGTRLVGILVSNYISLVAQWLWHWSIKSKYGVQQNEWDANPKIGTTHASPWKFISQLYPSFSSMLSLHVGDVNRVLFWEDN